MPRYVRISFLPVMQMVVLCLLFAGCANGHGFMGIDRQSGSQIINQTIAGRALSIYLPPGYDHAKQQYPVLYCYDGQDVFSALNLADTVDNLISKGFITPLIIVGIHSAAERTSETVPYADPFVQQDWGAYQPRAAEFARFVAENLVPFIESRYRTRSEAQYRALMGFSFGGLFALYACLRYDTVFSHALCLSPSFWVADYKIFDDVQQLPRKNLKVWFDIGTAEWNYYVPLLAVMRSKGYNVGRDVLYYEVPGGRHTAASWRERIANPVLMFAGTDRSDSIRSWRIEVEVIPSVSVPGRFFLRLNPIVTLMNGIQHSLADLAQYQLLNPDDGIIKEDGRFQFSRDRDLTVEVRYKHFSQKVRLVYSEIQRLMGKP